MLIARHLLKANLNTVAESLHDWLATENLNFWFVGRCQDWAAVWACDNCILTFRKLTEQTTELSLMLVRPDYREDVPAPNEDLPYEAIIQVGQCPSAEALSTWSYLLDQFQALAWLDSIERPNLSRECDYGDYLEDAFCLLDDSLQSLKQQLEYFETQYVPTLTLAESILTPDPSRLWRPADLHSTVAGELYLIALCRRRGLDPRQVITASTDSTQKPGRPSLDRHEWIQRLAKAQHAQELKAQEPNLTFKELVHRVHWHVGSTQESKIKLLREAMRQLENASPHLLEEIAAWREKEKKKTP